MIMATASSLIQQQVNANATPIPASSTLRQVLQSESVRRLFDQPNIVIHAIPRTNSPTAFRMVRPSIPTESKCNASLLANKKTTETSSSTKTTTKKTMTNGSVAAEAELATSPAAKPDVVVDEKEEVEEKPNEVENLLPSKNNGKSEILLVPVIRKRKECGHFEPCESLVCPVIVEQHENEDGLVVPLVSRTITDEDESENAKEDDNDETVKAKIDKHCENSRCDALSIDHDRCRAASVELHRCDKSSLCDVCGIAFLGDESRMVHKMCKRKHVYQHNTATPTEVFKYKMRQRELQMIESAKSKRSNDYLDPVLGMTRTMEALAKNDELIIIPKMPPFPSKIVKPCLAPLSSTHVDDNACTNSSYLNHSLKIMQVSRYRRKWNDDAGLTSERISSIIESCKQRIELENQQNGELEDYNVEVPSINQIQIKLSDHGSLNGATVRIVEVPNREKSLPIDLPTGNLAKQQFMANAGLQLTSVNNSVDSSVIPELDPDDEDKAKLRKLNDKGQPDQPYKVVTIVDFKSEPSLKHKKQGLPKFCVVPDIAPSRKLDESSPKMLEKLLVSKKKDEKLVVDDDGKTEANKKSPSEKKVGSDSSPKKEDNKPKSPVKVLPKSTDLIKSNNHPVGKLLHLSNNKHDGDRVTLPRKTKIKKIRRKRLKKPAGKIVKKYNCAHCEKSFSTLVYCQQHMSSQHENKPDFFCRLCERGFVNKILMKKHQEAEHKADEVRCEMCNVVLSSLAELTLHLKRSNGNELKRCADCGEEFSTCASLDLHMRRQHGFLVCVLCKRQIAKSMMMRHLMLEHGISKRRSESGFLKMTQEPGINDPIREMDLSKSDESVQSGNNSSNGNSNNNSNSKNQAEMARRSSSRRRSSKEFFACNVCERRFDSEKQYQIHASHYPLKFTPCNDCGKKFHRKADYTEHSKTCHLARSNEFNSDKADSTRKKRKTNLSSDRVVLKISDSTATQNSIDQKLNDSLESKCKKIKLKEENKVVSRTVDVDKRKETEDKVVAEDELSISKMERATVVNGLKLNSSDYLDKLDNNGDNNEIVKTEKFVQIQNVNVEEENLKTVEELLKSEEQSKTNSVKTAEEIDKSKLALSIIIQDHNYQVVQ